MIIMIISWIAYERRKLNYMTNSAQHELVFFVSHKMLPLSCTIKSGLLNSAETFSKYRWVFHHHVHFKHSLLSSDTSFILTAVKMAYNKNAWDTFTIYHKHRFQPPSLMLRAVQKYKKLSQFSAVIWLYCGRKRNKDCAHSD